VIRTALGVLAAAFALTHLPSLVSTLEDIDSVNFALGIRDFDIAAHRPHPPGYPVYIALGKLGVAIAGPFTRGWPASAIEARTMSVLSLLAALTAIVALYRVLSCLGGGRTPPDLSSAPWKSLDARALAATAVVVACPLFWYLGVRPMSDMPGLAAALASQSVLALAWWRQQPDATGERRLAPDRMTASGRMIVLGALLAGVAIGFRSQTAMLTLPLLLGVLADRIGRGVAGALLGATMALAIGVAVWAAPMLIATGGLDAYLAALGSQAGEDFAGVEMLASNPSPRLAAYALLRTFIYPWDSISLGGVITLLAVLGVVVMMVSDRRAAAAVALVSVPYLAFHLLFQDTTFVRYALPLVPPTVFLAIYGLDRVLGRAALPVAGGLAVWAVTIASPVLVSYGSEPSPTVRAVGAMNAAQPQGAPGALAFHQTFQRPLEAENVAIKPQLASPPRREWLELVRYWRDEHSQDLWFLADPRRTDLMLIDPRGRAEFADFKWQFGSLSDLGGMRPGAVRWYRLPPPGWFADEGWALSPETAGIARLMGRGPSIAPITAWVRRRPDAARLLVGGRHLGATSDPSAIFVAAIDGTEVGRWESAAGFFLQELDLAPGALSGDGPLARLTIASTSGGEGVVPTAIEQFDLQTRGSLMWAYDTGWHEAEFDPALGMWRWTSERSILRVVDAATPVTITIRAERPRRYFDDDPVVRMTAGDRLLGETRFDNTELWSVTVPLDALQGSNGRVTIETNLTFVPAERGEAPDRRRLGLRVFDVHIVARP
jgi:hypothetical protein